MLSFLVVTLVLSAAGISAEGPCDGYWLLDGDCPEHEGKIYFDDASKTCNTNVPYELNDVQHVHCFQEGHEFPSIDDCKEKCLNITRPQPTTERPEPTTEIPEITTSIPEPTTERQEISTERPEITSKCPKTEDPETTAQKAQNLQLKVQHLQLKIQKLQLKIQKIQMEIQKL